MKNLLQFITLLGLIVLAVNMAQGNDYEPDCDQKTLSPYFQIENGDPDVDRLPLKSTQVHVAISGIMAQVTVTQTYCNDGKRPINAAYIFPASTHAAVHNLTMKIGNDIITAQLHEKQIAQKKYEAAKEQGKTASLLDQKRPNVFSMNVANIMPGDNIDITLEYSELLIPTDGVYEFVYPTVVGPRYTGGKSRVNTDDDKWVENPYVEGDSKSQSVFGIDVELSTGIPLQQVICTSHNTITRFENSSLARIELDPNEQYGGNRDYILKYRLSGDQIESGLMMYKGPQENFFLMMTEPPSRIDPDEIPDREYIFVLDVSGSMYGFPLDTAKALVLRLISNLRSTDTFNIVLFAGTANIMSPHSLPANPYNIKRAMALIDSQQGGGGTELYNALQQSMGLPKKENSSRSVLVITDGFVSAEEDVFAMIQNNLNQTNVFAFGIGTSVNRYLIEGIARSGMGEPFVVTNPQKASQIAEQFKTYIESPVLTNINVTFEGFDTYQVEPAAIPDLFARRPVVVFGKWKNNLSGKITLSGTTGKGPFTRSIDLADVKPLESNKALPYLWARARLARLSDYNYDSNPDRNKDEIIALGLKYHLLTQYTSFVAVHETVRNFEQDASDVKQPLPLPQHVSNLAVGTPVAMVPEPELFLLVSLFGFLMLAYFVLKHLAIKIDQSIE